MHRSLIIRPTARVVFKQECKEGNFRFAHMRLRSFLTEVTLYRAGEAEKTRLNHALQPVLANQLRLVMWRWLLSACTTGLEYAGALLNYSCLGLVVFTGGACSWHTFQHHLQRSQATLSVLGQHSQVMPEKACTASPNVYQKHAVSFWLSRLTIKDWHCWYSYPAGIFLLATG